MLAHLGPASKMLEACARSAGQALACPFSSSDEFEASIITARRAEGAYGPTARQRRLYWGVVLMLLLAGLFVIL
ncbi:MAG: hypothetical protein M3R18_09500 [Pseudomonadota bacterium]|nr:hypothetical protein [Pseudomonadota bacterium]